MLGKIIIVVLAHSQNFIQGIGFVLAIVIYFKIHRYCTSNISNRITKYHFPRVHLKVAYHETKYYFYNLLMLQEAKVEV